VTIVHSRPDTVITTDHGPAYVYAASYDIDAAIVVGDFELLISESEAEHLARAIAPDAGYLDPDEPTADDIRQVAEGIAGDLRGILTIAHRDLGDPDDWTAEYLPDLRDTIAELLSALDDVVADLERLS
jgi:hypothetical protein